MGRQDKTRCIYNMLTLSAHWPYGKGKIKSKSMSKVRKLYLKSDIVKNITLILA